MQGDGAATQTRQEPTRGRPAGPRWPRTPAASGWPLIPLGLSLLIRTMARLTTCHYSAGGFKDIQIGGPHGQDSDLPASVHRRAEVGSRAPGGEDPFRSETSWLGHFGEEVDEELERRARGPVRASCLSPFV